MTAWISSLGRPREAIQAAMAHVLFNATGVLLFVGFVPHFADLIRAISPAATELGGIQRLAEDTPRQLANTHAVFNVFNLLLFLGFTNTLAKIVLRIVPPLPAEPVPETQPMCLDKIFLDQPAMAFYRVRLELSRVGDKVLGMIKDSFPALLVGTRERIVSLRRRDEEIDALSDAIVLYLHKLVIANLMGP